MTDHKVGHTVAQRALGYLKTEGLVTTSREGTFAAPGQVVYGAQQMFRGVQFPPAWLTDVRAAAEVTTPDYVVPIIGTGTVIRREWVSYAKGPGGKLVPIMLAVSWCPPWAAGPVPELLALAPLPEPGSAAALIESRAKPKRVISWSKEARKTRRVIDDGREAPLLELDDDARVQAEVAQWGTRTEVLEYLEFVLPEDLVVESDTQL